MRDWSKDGTLTCRGADPSEGESGRPQGTFVAVGVGNQSACAIRSDGSLACWGSSLTVASPPDGVFTKVVLGYEYACALEPTRPWCAGED